MALGDPVTLDFSWTTIIDAGAVATADNAGAIITTPDTQVTNSTTHIGVVWPHIGNGDFDTIALRYGYLASSGPTTMPQFSVFGRFGSGDPWTAMLDNSSTPVHTKAWTTAPTTDAVTGLIGYTSVAPANTMPTLGCREFLIAVQVASATGTRTSDICQAKILTLKSWADNVT